MNTAGSTSPPAISPDVVWLGELNVEKKYDLFAGARALVFPLTWSEPFGMVMIEAMACRTPVLATRHGSVSEVVADGITGSVRATPEEPVEAVGRINEIDRRARRQRVEECLSAEAMTASYERRSRAEVALQRRPHVATALRKVARAGV